MLAVIRAPAISAAPAYTSGAAKVQASLALFLSFFFESLRGSTALGGG
jgi:hypothetical protein